MSAVVIRSIVSFKHIGMDVTLTSTIHTQYHHSFLENPEVKSFGFFNLQLL